MKAHRTVTALGIAAIAALAAAAPAAADSIVYAQGGNVWLTSSDGAKRYQVTFDGGYDSPSQANDGTIVALHGKQLVRMDRGGRQIGAPVAGMGSTQGTGDQFYGPYEPRVSPDGKRIAYWFGQYSKYFSYGCNCYLWRVESQSTWTWSDRFTDPTTEGDYYKGITQPEWLTNDRALAAYGGFSQNIWTYKVGTGRGYTGNSAQVWFGYQDPNPDEWGVHNYYDFGDPALSPDGRKLALTDGGDANTNTRLWLASVDGPAWVGEPPYENDYMNDPLPKPPTMRCVKDLGVVVNPTWSPDSQKLAFSVADGIHVYGVPEGIDCSAVTDRLIVPGGAQPSYGPADVNLAQKPSPPSAGGNGGTRGATGGGRGAKLTVGRLTLRPTRFRAAGRGAAIARRAGTVASFRLSAPARLRFTVTRTNGRRVRGSIRTAGRPGRNRLRFTGRVGGRTLRPGRYVLRLSASPLKGRGAARPVAARFAITR